MHERVIALMRRITVTKGVKEVTIRSSFDYDFSSPLSAREPGHLTCTGMLQRMLAATYPDGVRVFMAGSNMLNISSATCKKLKVGACQDAGLTQIPPGLLTQMGNHKSWSTNMIYQVQQQQSMQQARNCLLAPLHILALPSNKHGIHDVDMSIRLLTRQIEKHQADVLGVVHTLHQSHVAHEANMLRMFTACLEQLRVSAPDTTQAVMP